MCRWCAGTGAATRPGGYVDACKPCGGHGRVSVCPSPDVAAIGGAGAGDAGGPSYDMVEPFSRLTEYDGDVR